jgi:CO/xanthine dehydrogenase Mo-binding subunit
MSATPTSGRRPAAGRPRGWRSSARMRPPTRCRVRRRERPPVTRPHRVPDRGVSGAIGVRRRRVDGEAKVRGATRFAADLPVHGLLHGRPVVALEAHARVVSIDASAALELDGVVAVLTAADLPIAAGASGRASEPLAREEVVFAGQPVALVVADSEAAATDGVDLVLVELEPLPAVLDPAAAMAPGAPLARVGDRRGPGHDAGGMHGAGAGGETLDDGEPSANVEGRHRSSKGDATSALAGADAVVAGRVDTGWIHQAYLETQAATAWLDPEGELVVSTATQGAFSTREQLAELLELPLERVRVRPTPLGGAFGGKLMLIEPLVAAAALALRRPLRLALTRMEDFGATNPAPAQAFELELGAARDGRLAAIRGRIVCDRGVNDEFGVESISIMLAGGPYRWAARDLRAYGVVTNRVGSGSYRAPGGPPAAFAVETLLDELAAAVELDPIELRLRNVLETGDRGPDGKALQTFGARACLERARDHPLWRRRAQLPDGEGVGVAIGFWPGGLEPAAALCRLDSDGGLTVQTGAVDMSGTETGFIAIAAEAFGLAPERVRVVAGDTAGAPYAGASGGSKITYTVGRAVQRAATQARERLLAVAAHELEIAPEDLELADGLVRPRGAPSRAVPVADLARRALDFGSPHEPIEGHGGVAQTSRAPSSAAHLSHVAVDRETGGVRLLHHVVIQDVGFALNPALVEDQMLGGTVQGLGWALYEEMLHDEAGQLRTGTFADYSIPTAGVLPPIETVIVEVPAPDGPFGAKGVGEAPVVATAAAVANAIAAATGVRMRRLPMTPQRVWAALREA